MKSEQDIRLKYKALIDIQKSPKDQDTVSQAILAGQLAALEWVLSNESE